MEAGPLSRGRQILILIVCRNRAGRRGIGPKKEGNHGPILLRGSVWNFSGTYLECVLGLEGKTKCERGIKETR